MPRPLKHVPFGSPIRFGGTFGESRSTRRTGIEPALLRAAGVIRIRIDLGRRAKGTEEVKS